MKFCMVTTFFGAHSFGGDAAYVDRLSRALLSRGHHVAVVHSIDAFEALRGKHPLRKYSPPPGLEIHGLRDPFSMFGLLWTHQTGRVSTIRRQIEEIIASGAFDVIHFHNISLIGMDVLHAASNMARPVRLMTAHEYWLVCPLSLLWKFEREPCQQAACIRCTLEAGRPPQLWRDSSLRDRMLGELDALIVPSAFAKEAHLQRGINFSIEQLPYFMPDELVHRAAAEPAWPSRARRPYFAAVGRLVKEKGFDELIAQMRDFPEADLLIAGAGPHETALRGLAENAANVHFLGLLDESQLFSLYKGARALVVPSKFWETFGYVLLEGFAVGCPAIVRDCGALPELVRQSDAGDVYQSDTELRSLLRRYLNDPDYARERGEKGRRAQEAHWNEAEHLKRYLNLIEQAGSSRGSR